MQANEDMFELMQDITNLYQCIVIDPQNESNVEQVNKMLKSEKCVGIKLHPVLYKYCPTCTQEEGFISSPLP